MQGDGDNDDGGGHDGDGAVAPTSVDRDGYLRVPHFDARDFDRDAGPVFERLGRPRDAKGYKFTDPDPKVFVFNDTDKEMRENFRGVAHKLNLTQRQVAGLHDWQVASAKLQRDAERAAANEGGRKTMALFQKEWGTSFGD